MSRSQRFRAPIPGTRGCAAAALVFSLVCVTGATASAAKPPPGPTVSGPRAPLAGNVTYSFHAKRGSRFRCSLDRPNLHRCPAVYRITLTAGAHVLRVRSIAPGGSASRLTVVRIKARNPLPSAGSVVARIPIDNGPMGLAFTGGALFVTQHEGDAVVRVDPVTNAVSGRVSVTVGSADQPGRLAVGDGELWEVTYSGVPGAAVRIDPATLDVLQRISLQGMLCCTAAVSTDSLWLSAPDDNVVYRVDPASGNVIASIALPSPGLGVLGGGALWLISGNDVVRIDPAANTVSARIAAPEGAWVEGYAAGSVWLSTSSGLARLDPTTNKVTAQIPIPGGCAFFAFDGTSVWTSGTGDGHAGLWRIDASSNAVTGFVPLEPATRDAIGDVAVGAGAVWATLFGGIHGNTVVRVAPAGTMN